MSLDTKFQEAGNKKVAAALAAFLTVASTTLAAITPQEVQAETVVRGEAALKEDRLILQKFRQAKEFSRHGGLGIVVQTSPEQEKVFSAGDMADRIGKYLKGQGVTSMSIYTVCGSGFFSGSGVSFMIGGQQKAVPMESVNREFLDGIVREQKSAQALSSGVASAQEIHACL